MWRWLRVEALVVKQQIFDLGNYLRWDFGITFEVRSKGNLILAVAAIGLAIVFNPWWLLLLVIHLPND